MRVRFPVSQLFCIFLCACMLVAAASAAAAAAGAAAAVARNVGGFSTSATGYKIVDCTPQDLEAVRSLLLRTAEYPVKYSRSTMQYFSHYRYFYDLCVVAKIDNNLETKETVYTETERETDKAETEGEETEAETDYTETETEEEAQDAYDDEKETARRQRRNAKYKRKQGDIIGVVGAAETQTGCVNILMVAVDERYRRLGIGLSPFYLSLYLSLSLSLFLSVSVSV